MVQDLLAGFFIITEKQYGFGDLVALTVAGSRCPAEGTVEDVTLRVTKLRSIGRRDAHHPQRPDRQDRSTCPRTGRAPSSTSRCRRLPTSTGSTRCCTRCARRRCEDPALRRRCCSTQPQLMGVESIELDTVNLRMVARTLPGKQFEVGRRLRVLVIAALRARGHRHARRDDAAPTVGAIAHPRHGRRRRGDPGSGGADEVKLDAARPRRRAQIGRAGRATCSAAGCARRPPRCIVAFVRLSWLQQTYRAAAAGAAAAPARWCRRVSCPTPSTPGCRAPNVQEPTHDTPTTHDHHDDDHRPDRDDHHRPERPPPPTPTSTTPPTTVVDPDGLGPAATADADRAVAAARHQRRRRPHRRRVGPATRRRRPPAPPR